MDSENAYNEPFCTFAATLLVYYIHLEESKSYIALGLQYGNEADWVISESVFVEPIYAAELNNTFVGVLVKGACGTLKLSARYGLAFDRPYTANHDLIFIFSLI